MKIKIYVQPRASRSEIVGMHGDALKIRLAAPPVDGAANDELVRFIAKTLGTTMSNVRISAGARSRTKTVEISNVEEAIVAQKLKCKF